MSARTGGEGYMVVCGHVRIMGGGGQKKAKFVWTSFMDGPFKNYIQDLDQGLLISLHLNQLEKTEKACCHFA